MRHSRLPVTCACLLLGVAAGTWGCATTRVAQPTEKDYAAVRGGRAAVVMLRGLAEVDGGERTLFGPGAAGGGKSLSLARLDTADKLRSAGALRSPSAGALQAGWVYLVLKPGTYYLLIHDPTADSLAPDAAAPGEDWLLEVPAGAPLVYAGSVVFTRPGAAGEQSAGDPYRASHAARARDDSAEARETALSAFPGLGADRVARMRTMALRRYTGPVDSHSPGGGPNPTTPRVEVHGAPSPTGFDVRGACAQDGAWTGLLYGDPILSSAGSSTNTVADVFLLMVKGGLYFWAGTGAIAGSIGGGGAARDLQPCVAQSVRWAGEYDLSRRLSESLTRGLEPAGPGPGDEDRPVLRVSVQELHLRPCRNAHLACVEAKVRVRLWDPRAQRHEADRVLLYSHPSARHRTRPYGAPPQRYVLPLDDAAVVDLRALRRLPPQDRRRRIEAELDRAVAVLSGRILRDLQPAVDPARADTKRPRQAPVNQPLPRAPGAG